MTYEIEHFSGTQDLIGITVVGCTYVSYVIYTILTDRKKNDGNPFSHTAKKLLWTGLWLGYIFKGTRGAYLSSWTYALAAFCLAGLFLLTLNPTESHSRRFAVTYLMFFYWAYVTQSVFMNLEISESLRDWLVLTAVWVTIYRCASKSESNNQFVREMFAGVSYLTIVVTSTIAFFTLLWPDLSIADPYRIIGPFVNGVYLSHALAILLIGVFFRRYFIEKSPDSTAKFLFISAILIIALCSTVSRSGIVLGLAFIAPVTVLYAKKRLLSMVFFAGLITMVLLAFPRDKLVERFQVGGGERDSLLMEQLSEAKGQLLLGHGFGASKKTTFSTRREAERGLASHSFLTSTLYDLGLIGTALAVALCVSVIVQYARQLKGVTNRRPVLCLLAWFGCLAVAQVENMFWNGNVVLSVIVVSIMSMAGRNEPVFRVCSGRYSGLMEKGHAYAGRVANR